MQSGKRGLRAGLFLLCAMLVLPAWAQQGFVHRQGKILVDGKGAEVHLRGTNFGNWMVPEGYMFKFEDGPQSPREIEALTQSLLGPAEAEQFWSQYRHGYITKEDVHLLKKANFNTVRIPLHYKFFLPGNEEGFALLDPVIRWASEEGIYVILDMHCAPGGQTGTNIDDSVGYPWLFESETSQQQLVAVWERIAARYRENKTVIGYDLLNEPLPAFPELKQYHDKLEPLYKKVTTAIRKVDGNHLIILGGANWDTDFSVFGEPFDKNVLYTLHKYWMTPDQASIQNFLDFREKYQVPLYLGESGENKTEWIAEFAALLDKNDIGWTFWPYKKMASDSSFVTFAAPEGWNEITAYASRWWTTGKAKESLKSRPSVELSRKSFAELLTKTRLENCTVNDAYIHALDGSPAPTSQK